MTPVSQPRRHSISRKLTWMNMLVSGAALLLACLSFVAYDLTSFRSAIVGNLLVRSKIIGANSVTALTFNDARAAETTLSALEGDPNIVSASLYGPDGRLFAGYRRSRGVTTTVPESIATSELTQLSWRNDPGIVLVRPIVFQGALVGTVRFLSDLEAVHARMSRYALIGIVVLAGSLTAAFAVSRVAQRSIARPLARLAEVAAGISRDRDYSVRASAAGSGYEFDLLIAAFNDMLMQIEQRDAALLASRAQLEERVDERTAELTVVNQELEAFSYSVSHDLRAPLRHVSGFVSLLEDHAGAVLDAQGRRYLATIATASARMGQLIDDLLAFSRMSRTALTKNCTSLDAVVQEARCEVMAPVTGRDIAWTIHPLPEVDADPAMLRMVFVNLLSNAAKYTSTRPRAQIEVGVAGCNDHETVVFVRDNGVGFDMEYGHKLFGVFQRLHRAEDFEGTGIGLANVRRIIQRHGGRTWAEGAVEQGATFYVSLPNDRQA
jgi:signal transduction histidine kinase